MKPRSQLHLDLLRVLDGGMATELERRGCDISGPLWSAHVLDTAPAVIRQVHLDYLRAGADCISTVSYQISALGYAELGRSRDDAARSLRQSVAIAEAARDEYREESDRPILIAASLGPYGAALHNGAEFHGRYTIGFDDLVAFHTQRLAVLADTSADLIAIETVPSLEEAKAISAALVEFPAIGAWVSFTCIDSSRVAHGELLSECATFLNGIPQVAALGINCTQPRLIAALIDEAKSTTGKPLFVYPNSGESWDTRNRHWYGTSDIEAFAQHSRAWYAAGAYAVGGCCRTTPGHIRAVREAFDTDQMPAASIFEGSARKV